MKYYHDIQTKFDEIVIIQMTFLLKIFKTRE